MKKKDTIPILILAIFMIILTGYYRFKDNPVTIPSAARSKRTTGNDFSKIKSTYRNKINDFSNTYYLFCGGITLLLMPFESLKTSHDSTNPQRFTNASSDITLPCDWHDSKGIRSNSYLPDTFFWNGYEVIRMVRKPMVNYFTCSVMIYRTWI